MASSVAGALRCCRTQLHRATFTSLRPGVLSSRLTLDSQRQISVRNFSSLEWKFSKQQQSPVWCGLSEKGGLHIKLRSCSRKAPDISDATEPWRDISHPELKKMLTSGEIFLVDVREKSELDETGTIDERVVHIPLGSVKDAFNLSPRQFEQRYGVEMPDPLDGNIVFQCRAGVRSRQALRDAHECGFTEARHYLGGWLQWEELEKV